MTGWLFVLALALLTTRYPGVSVTYCVGIAASGILLFSSSTVPDSPVMVALAKLTLGIYLVHAAVLTVLRHLGVEGVALATSTFSLSAMCIWAAHRVVPPGLMKYVA